MFDLEYAEIARIVGKREDNVRQIAARARRHVDERRPRFDASREERDGLAERFFAAAAASDADALARTLAPDVAFYGDGGGKVKGAIPRPVFGRDHVLRLLLGFAADSANATLRLRLARVNGQPGAVFVRPDGSPFSVLALDVLGRRSRDRDPFDREPGQASARRAGAVAARSVDAASSRPGSLRAARRGAAPATRVDPPSRPERS